MKETLITLNLETMMRISNLAMANRKDQNQIPLLIAKLEPGKTPGEQYHTLTSILDDEFDVYSHELICVEYIEFDPSKAEHPLILIEEYEIENRSGIAFSISVQNEE